MISQTVKSQGIMEIGSRKSSGPGEPLREPGSCPLAHFQIELR